LEFHEPIVLCSSHVIPTLRSSLLQQQKLNHSRQETTLRQEEIESSPSKKQVQQQQQQHNSALESSMSPFFASAVSAELYTRRSVVDRIESSLEEPIQRISSKEKTLCDEVSIALIKFKLAGAQKKFMEVLLLDDEEDDEEGPRESSWKGKVDTKHQQFAEENIFPVAPHGKDDFIALSNTETRWIGRFARIIEENSGKFIEVLDDLDDEEEPRESWDGKVDSKQQLAKENIFPVVPHGEDDFISLSKSETQWIGRFARIIEENSGELPASMAY
jgi:hypothetical protein